MASTPEVLQNAIDWCRRERSQGVGGERCLEAMQQEFRLPLSDARWVLSWVEDCLQPFCETETLFEEMGPEAIAILAGGKSTRMGRDKLHLKLGDRTLLKIVLDEAARLRLPVRIIDRDETPGLGPLGGILTALRGAPERGILVLSGDMPFVTADLMVAVGAARKPGDLALFVADQEGRFGFPAVLTPGAIPIIEAQLAREERSIKRLIPALNASVWPVPEPFTSQLFNVNTPEDFARAEQRHAGQSRHG